MKTIHITYYQHFTDTCPTQTTMEHIAELIRTDKTVAAKTAAHRTNPQARYKESCPLFAVAGIMEGGKRTKDIVCMTGLSMVDIDHVSNHPSHEQKKTTLQELLQKIKADPHTMLCYRTISGDGIRVIFPYEVEESMDLEQQKNYYPKVFAYGNNYYSQLLQVPYDEQCKNVGRLSGIAHDEEVYYQPEAVPFSAQEIRSAVARLVEENRSRRKMARERNRIQACFDKIIKQEVEDEGAVYAPASHNDYVMRVGYKLNQFGFCSEAAKEWARDAFREYEDTVSVLESCYRKTEEFGCRQQRSHSSRTPIDNPNIPFATVEDIQAFLAEHIQLRHNVITGRVEYKAEDDRWLPLTDRIVNSLWRKMAKTHRVLSQDILRIIQSDYIPSYHPFREYLESLEEVPDEIDYIRALANTITLKSSPPLQGESEGVFYEYLKKWLVAMVAGWLDETVVNNVILVLIGEQGSYKTTWFSYLLPPSLRHYFYTKTNANRMGRDDLLTLAQYGLVCCEELDAMRPSELNQLKAAVTMTSIDERAAYAHFHEHRPHIASFCGTGNNTQFLSDPSGNRRWLPFEVESIRSPREHPFPYEGIYAQAYRLYKSGFQYWFSQEEITRLSEHNRQFEAPKLERELIQLYFRKPAEGETGEFVSVARALQIIGVGISQKLNTVSIGRAFIELDFRKKVYRNVRGYLVVQRSAEEIKSIQRLMAACDGREKNTDTDQYTGF